MLIFITTYRRNYWKHMVLLVSILLLTIGTLINVSMVPLLMVVMVLVLSVSLLGFLTVILFVIAVFILVSLVDVLLKKYKLEFIGIYILEEKYIINKKSKKMPFFCIMDCALMCFISINLLIYIYISFESCFYDCMIVHFFKQKTAHFFKGFPTFKIGKKFCQFKQQRMRIACEF